MRLVKIAWRNLGRNRVRTSIAVLAITTVVLIVVFARGLMVGFIESSFTINIDNFHGHVRVIDEDYQRREALLPLDYTIADYTDLVGSLEELDSVEHILPRIRFGARAYFNNNQTALVVVGVDPGREEKHGVLEKDISSGRMPQSGNQVLVGAGLLDKLGAELGEKLTLVYADSQQQMQQAELEIVGVRDTGIGELDDSFLFLPLETASEMLGLDGEVTELLIFASNAQRTDTLSSEVEALFADLGVETHLVIPWNAADPFVEFFSEMAGEIMDMVYVMFVLMGTVVVIITLTMIVRERTTEIGLLSAMGLKGREIMNLFVLEGAFMGLLGSFLGVVTGGLITFYYSQHGLRVEAFAELSGDMDIILEPVFHIAFNLENLVVSFVLGVVIVTLSCLFPARKAARMEPADALHHVEE